MIKTWTEASGRPMYELMLSLDAKELWLYRAAHYKSTEDIWKTLDGTWMLWLLARSMEHLEQRPILDSICRELGGDTSSIPPYWDKNIHGLNKPINLAAKPKALADAVVALVAKMEHPLRDAIAADVILKYAPNAPVFSKPGADETDTNKKNSKST
jgi:hypothetical protein